MRKFLAGLLTTLMLITSNYSAVEVIAQEILSEPAQSQTVQTEVPAPDTDTITSEPAASDPDTAQPPSQTNSVPEENSAVKPEPANIPAEPEKAAVRDREPGGPGGQFVLKKVAAPVEGLVIPVTFKLELQTAGTTDQWTDKGTFDVNTGDKNYVSEKIPAGHYKITETKGTGLTLAPPIEFDIENGKITGSKDQSSTPALVEGYDSPIVITNHRQGTLSITKKGAFKDAQSGRETDVVNLAGVEFSLYTNEACTGTPIATAVTDASGNASFTYLDNGTYWLKETNIGEANDGKYTMDTNVQKIEIIDGGSVLLTGDSSIINYTTYGKIKIRKVDENAWHKYLQAQFGIYTSKDCTSKDTVKDINGAIATITTNSQDGFGTSPLIKATKEGTQYWLKEDVLPDGYTTAENGAIYGPFTVKSNETAMVDKPITNRKLFSIDVIKAVTNKPNIKLDGVKIGLYATEADAKNNTNPIDTKTTENSSAKVTFTDLVVAENGKATYYYRELSVPAGYDLNESVHAVPIDYNKDFDTAKVISTITNDMLGTFSIKKIGRFQGTDDSVPQVSNLAKANFAVYKTLGDKVPHISGEPLAATLITDINGLATSAGLEPGWYELIEIVAPSGYAKLDESIWIQVENNKNNDSLVKTPIENIPEKGKLLILKEDDAGAALSGAVFNIYPQKGDGYDTNPIDTVTISGSGYNYTKLLPAQPLGTKYKVVEVKAPAGYTLDDSITPTSKEILLYPIHSPAEGKNDNKNVVKFINISTDKVKTFLDSITKNVSDDDETDLTLTKVNAKESLLSSDYTANFTLSGYADGTNEVPAEKFTVTDNNLTLQWLDSTTYKDLAPNDFDYDITGITVLPASNKDTKKPVKANIYYQKDVAAKQTDSWVKFGDTVDVSAGTTIDLQNVLTSVVGIKVEYLNVDVGFKAAGIKFTATFPNRAEHSTAEMHEVRRITNTANLKWTDCTRDENGDVGQTAQKSADVNSNITEIIFPPYDNKIPQVSISNQIEDQQSTYYSGNTINYKITATNHNVENQNANFTAPVISFRFPALTDLDETKYENGLLIYKTDKTGKSTDFLPSDYQVKKVTTKAALTDNGNDSYTDSDKIDTIQYVIEWNKNITLEETEQIIIKMSGKISFVPKADNGVTNLVFPAYLSSTAFIPKSAENPLGLCFDSYNKEQQKYNNDITDQQVNKKLKYLNQTNTVKVLDPSSIGDYVWYDENNDGLQTPGEESAQGISVTLKKDTYKHNIDGAVQKTTTTVSSTQTNQDGFYTFAELPCDNLKQGAPENSENPSDYVGGEYYRYWVQFTIPDGCIAAKQTVGDDRAIDSDIDKFGNTKPIALKIIRNDDGTFSGENNPTIDAGLVKLYALGDYVWSDLNNNGIQDKEEPGVKDVPVSIYKANAKGEADESGYFMQTTTDANGYYIFKNLVPGNYIIEFDISKIPKEDGHSNRYEFTKTTVSDEILGTDSDAKYAVDADGRIKRTDVITLNKQSIEHGHLKDNTDPRWDAGIYRPDDDKTIPDNKTTSTIVKKPPNMPAQTADETPLTLLIITAIFSGIGIIIFSRKKHRR